MTRGTDLPRTATEDDAVVVAELLDRFNREFNTATPGPIVLASRLERLFLGGDVMAVLAGTPAVGVALLTMRPNVWYNGPVGLLDELYVVPGERRRGIGAALLRTAESLCRHRGGELLEIKLMARTPTLGVSTSATATRITTPAKPNRSSTTLAISRRPPRAAPEKCSHPLSWCVRVD